MFGAGQQQRSAADSGDDRRLSGRLNEASSSRQSTRSDGRHSSASQQQQVQFHSFNENDDNDDDDEEDDDEDQRDPYNSKPNYRQYYYTSNEPQDQDHDDEDDHHQRRHHYDELGPVPAAAAYDSMSTILEVDSDEANSSIGQSPEAVSSASERARELDSPVEVRTTPTRRRYQSDETQASEYSKTAQGYDAGSPVGRISPEDKFGGALSALAAQMERLQRSIATEPTESRVGVGGGQEKNTSKQMPQKISASGSSKWPNESAQLSPDQTRSGKQHSDARRPADSLMMISISPIGTSNAAIDSPISPLIKTSLTSPESTLPIGRSQHRAKAEPDTERKVVEVSNRSTMTSINLELMDKLLAKYYVEQQDKACQSIKFDCDLEDEFDIVEQQDGSSSLSRRSRATSSRFVNNSGHKQQQSVGQSNNIEIMAKPQMKSVAIGTEKFARERFSLLPQTKTRSTQTGPNLNDSDHGTSETRRFKLSSHLSDLSSLLRSSSSPSTSSLALADEEAAKLEHKKSSTDESAARARETTSANHKDNEIGREEASPSTRSTSDESVSMQTEDQNENKSDKIGTKSGSNQKEDETKVAGAKQAQSDIVPNSTSKTSKEFNQNETPSEVQLPKPVSVESKKAPSLKTELRVIIEFADSRRKQRNELKSNAQLVDGKLSKRTEVSTSKQVAVSPRQVRDELELAGQRHSILLNPRHKRQTRDEWHEISKSSVCNEIETDTRESRRQSSDVNDLEDGARERAGESKQQIGDIVMSSEATIRQLPSDQSAIELRSRAAQRYASNWPAAAGANGERAPEGERLLVESAAAFDESQPFDTEGDSARVGQLELRQLERNATAGREQDETRKTPAGGHADRLSPQAVDSAIRSRFEPDPKVSSSLVNIKRPAQRVEANGSETTLMKVDDGRQPMRSNNEQTRPSQRPQSPRYLSSPNLSQQRGQQQQQPMPQVRSASRFEFDERSEDRRQVTRNGRLVYDDRLREHHRYERRPAGSADGEQNLAGGSRQRGERADEQTTKSTPASADKTGVKNNDLQVGLNQQWRSQSQSNLASGQTLRADYNKQRGALNERRHQLENGTIATRMAAANNGPNESERLPAGGFSSPQINERTSNVAQVEELVRPKSGSNLASGQTASRLRLSPALNRQAQLLRPIRLQTGEVGTPPPPQPLVSPPNLFADHTSNLSHSDPETMDSGFVQSGAGSSNNINQLQQQLTRPNSRLARAQRTGRASAQLADMSELEAETPANERASGHESLTFVDADEEREDELLQQLGAGIGIDQRRQRFASGDRVQRGFRGILFDGDQTNKSTTTKTLQQPTGERAPQPTDKNRPANARPPANSDMVTPPPTFKLDHMGGASKQTQPNQTRTTTDSDQTELTTRLTRCKFNESRNTTNTADNQKRQRRRTLTKLDQNLVAPNFECLLRERAERFVGSGQAKAQGVADGNRGQRRRLLEACRFKAQVVFESDTDSAAERLSATGGRRSAASSLANTRRRPATKSNPPNGSEKVKDVEKQLITETKYSLTNGFDGKQNPDHQLEQQQQQQQQQQWRAGSSDGQQLAQKRPPLLQPNWDYSLRVNRMRGNKVDSRVSTHIKHSRQPAPNRSQAS